MPHAARRPAARRAAALLAAAALTTCALLPAAAAAQLPTAPRPARRYVAQTVAINPLALPFGVASAEYERAVGRGGLALGVGGLSTFAAGDGSLADRGEAYRTLQAKLKYYPREDGLRGFAVGITAGVVHAHDVSSHTFTYVGDNIYSSTTTLETRAQTAPTLGAALDYNLFIGRQRRFLLGFGVGAKRVLGSINSSALDRTLADGRLQIGFGF